MILEVFSITISIVNNSDSMLRFLIGGAVVRGPLLDTSVSDGKALSLTGKVKAFGTDLKKNKQGLVSGYPTAPCR